MSCRSDAAYSSFLLILLIHANVVNTGEGRRFGGTFLIFIIICKKEEFAPFLKNMSALLDERLQHKSTHALAGRYRITYTAHKLGPNVPLLVFIHGLGGQITQFQHQLLHFSHCANVLAIDLLGHGRSLRIGDDDSLHVPVTAQHVSLSAIAADLSLIFDLYRLDINILIAHSMGCALIALMLKHRQHHPHPPPPPSSRIAALILIGPKFHVPPWLRFLAHMPHWLFNLYRWYARQGHLYSPSVNAMLSPTCHDQQVRRLQYAVGLDSSTATFLAIVGSVAAFPTASDWARLRDLHCPILCIVGEDDTVCPIDKNAQLIHRLLQSSSSSSSSSSSDATLYPPPVTLPNAGHNCMMEQPGLLNALVAKFLITDCQIKTLDTAHQLLEMSDPGYKWNMKNYDKWKHTPNVSHLITTITTTTTTTSTVTSGTNKNGAVVAKLRGMKVMRKGDDDHSPSVFRHRFPHVGLVIDISKDPPPYDTTQVPYYKLPTQSKRPPTPDQVAHFIQIVHRFFQSIATSPHPPMVAGEVSVHCHYGYNRTGFMICSYLIEKGGMAVDEAIRVYERAREHGIRHVHFKDELYLRYAHKTRA